MNMSPSYLRPLYSFQKRPELAYILTLFIALAIIWLSLSPLDALPPAPGGDKLHHFIAYGALSFPVCFVKSPHQRLFLIGFILLGGFIELVQPYVNRYGEWADFGANLAGVIIGYLLARLLDMVMIRLA